MSSISKNFAAWYGRLATFNVEALFARRKARASQRTIFVNESLPSDYFDQKNRPKKRYIYVTNQVITSKYTIITFLPRNLLEQFRRIANIFFLGIAILQFFPKFATISPGLVILPLLTVLTITALKDAWEDIKRHQSDRRVNHSHVRVLSGGGWANPNLTGGKSRTFVRGLIQRQRGITNPNPENIELDTLDHPENADATAAGSEPSTQDQPRPTDRHHWKETLWEDLRVGDIVKITDNESIPADIVICSTSDPENVAFVETKNLDGETNLKSRHAVSALTHLRTAADCANRRNAFHVKCDRPHENMYQLEATVETADDRYPVDIQMTLLRGTVLRNTDWVIGVVLYTGTDSKIVLNSGGTPSKRSKVERQMNPQVLINLMLLALMATTCAIVGSIIEHKQSPEGAPWLYDDNSSGDNPNINGLVTWAFALISFQNIVPISLYISIEFVRTVQAAFIYFDKEIWYEKTDQPTLSRSWNLSDDLGQIEYIISDKTGTLTRNSMVFRRCCIGGKVYQGDPNVEAEEEKPVLPLEVKPNSIGDVEATSAIGSGLQEESSTSSSGASPLVAEQIKLPKGVLHRFRDSQLIKDLADAANPIPENESFARTLHGFFVVLALCHTVLTSVDPETSAIEYKAQSPDEAALVQAAADVGFVFRGRERETLSLQTPFSNEIEKYELLNILEFTSARKRMSVVVRRLNGEDRRLFLLTKGADNVIFERLKSGAEDLKEEVERHLDEFASEGLRTLTLAYKVISDAEFTSWNERYHEATVSLEDRKTRIEQVSEELERDLRLLGATAIEDRLQDGVPEAIADLKRAGIKLWVATGDKVETAIAIGHSTNLIGRDSNIIVIRSGVSRPVFEQMIKAFEDCFPESELPVVEARPRTSMSSDRSSRPGDPTVASIIGSHNGDKPGGFILVIDGGGLADAIRDDDGKRLLLGLATQCEGVLCCRVSPLQKALLVKLVKDDLGAMTLAIGDGANDVSMIQAAHVGVGITGEEGLQAVNSSDYAIGQFRFLTRLLFVHGHWSYYRNGNMILNFFYKNIVCIGVLWWFQIYCAWSAVYVFEYTFLLFWNSFWTLAPVIAIGIFDRLVDDRILVAIPELYHHGREGAWFGLGSFILYMLDGFYQSAIIFFIILYAYFSPTSRTDGYSGPLYEFSTTMVLSAVLVANMFNGLNTNAWTGWVFFAVSIGTVLAWIWAIAYTEVSPGWVLTDIYGYYAFLFPSAFFWLCQPIVFFLSLLPRYLAKSWRFGFNPDDISILRYISKMQPEKDVAKEVRTSGRLAALRRPMSNPSRASSVDLHRRPSLDMRLGSRTDMATGIRSVHRGFDFATEEGGIALKRMQTNLSERRQSSRNLALVQEEGLRHRASSLLKTIRRKKPPTPDRGGGE